MITTNCAVLGTALTNVQAENDFVTSVVTGLGTAIGFCIAIVIMAGVREKTENNNFPKSFVRYTGSSYDCMPYVNCLLWLLRHLLKKEARMDFKQIIIAIAVFMRYQPYYRYRAQHC